MHNAYEPFKKIHDRKGGEEKRRKITTTTKTIHTYYKTYLW